MRPLPLSFIGAPFEVQTDPIYHAADQLTTWIAVQAEGPPPFSTISPSVAGLTLALFTQAVQDSHSLSKRIREDAQAWFSSGERSFFSFLWICDLYQLDPSAVRLALKLKTVRTGREMAHLIRYRRVRHHHI